MEGHLFTMVAAVVVVCSAVLTYILCSVSTRWDTCAPHVIVEEAGGSVFPFDASGEGGMANVAALLASKNAGGASPSSSLGDVLRLAYNKPDLSSPSCVFLGRCSV